MSLGKRKSEFDKIFLFFSYSVKLRRKNAVPIRSFEARRKRRKKELEEEMEGEEEEEEEERGGGGGEG